MDDHITWTLIISWEKDLQYSVIIGPSGPECLCHISLIFDMLKENIEGRLLFFIWKLTYALS